MQKHSFHIQNPIVDLFRFSLAVIQTIVAVPDRKLYVQNPIVAVANPKFDVQNLIVDIWNPKTYVRNPIVSVHNRKTSLNNRNRTVIHPNHRHPDRIRYIENVLLQMKDLNLSLKNASYC